MEESTNGVAIGKDGIFAGRFSAEIEGSFVVFLIGMRVNRLLQFKKWSQAVMAMPPMLQELYTNPDQGFLGGESFFRLGPVTTILVTYWRSFEHLEHFARSKDDPHFPAWKEFYQKIGLDGSVGIWHETYMVPAGHYEALYANMPRFGLAAASNHIEARMQGRGKSLRSRYEGSLNAAQSPMAEQPVR